MSAVDVAQEDITLPLIPRADHTVHWPTGSYGPSRSYRCCKRHADGLRVLAGHLGFHLLVEEPVSSTHEVCQTCLQELAQEANDTL